MVRKAIAVHSSKISTTNSAFILKLPFLCNNVLWEYVEGWILLRKCRWLTFRSTAVSSYDCSFSKRQRSHREGMARGIHLQNERMQEELFLKIKWTSQLLLKRDVKYGGRKLLTILCMYHTFHFSEVLHWGNAVIFPLTETWKPRHIFRYKNDNL